MPSAHRSLSVPLRSPLLGVVLCTTLLAVSACGDGTASEGPAGTPTASATSAVVVTRTGGLAGVDDELSVTADGAVTGSTRSGPVTCTVPAATVTVLATAPAPSAAPAAGTDRLTVLLDRTPDAVELGEAQGSDPLSVTVRALLDDVQLPPQQRTVCR